MEREEKLKALDAALGQIERQFGKGAVMKLGDPSVQMNVETIPTGSLSLDLALGLGGIPKGRIIEIYGPESSGKTTVTLHMIAEVQKRGGIAGFIDAEHALDPVYAKNIGVDIDNLYISQPDCGEQALEITETMVRSGAVDIIVVDSVAALVPKAEIDGDMGDAHVGLQARLMSQALRKLTAVISKSNCTVVFINQLREKVGVMFGNPETTTGGKTQNTGKDGAGRSGVRDADSSDSIHSFVCENRSGRHHREELRSLGQCSNRKRLFYECACRVGGP